MKPLEPPKQPSFTSLLAAGSSLVRLWLAYISLK